MHMILIPGKHKTAVQYNFKGNIADQFFVFVWFFFGGGTGFLCVSLEVLELIL